jgi:3-oxoacyl-[acyl-carrier-protein] synthase II
VNTRRVVVTGMGVLSPIGNNIEEFRNGLQKGASGIVPIWSFDTSKHRTKYGGEIRDFDPYTYNIPNPDGLDLCGQYAIAAIDEALKNAYLLLDRIDPFRAGISFGVLAGGVMSFDHYLTQKFETGKSDPKLAMQSQSKITSDVARRLKIHGPNVTTATACAAGLGSICYGFDCIRYGHADVMITGGSDPLTRSTYAGFNSLQAVSKTASKPFDRDRDGISMGGGSGALILEELDFAQKRGSPILAEVRGYGLSNDANHQTEPHPQGLGAILAMKRALIDAGLSNKDIDYIGGHGTATEKNDEAELIAVKGVFGERAGYIPISSIKSMVGHTMGASGSLTAISCILAIKYGFLPPTINFQNPIQGFENWDFVPNQSRQAQVHVTMANAFGFGGHTTSLIISSITQ